MTIRRWSLPALCSIALLAGCEKAAETASNKVAEKMVEAALSKDGVQAKVDLSGSQGGQVSMSTTDASGKTSQVNIGGSKVDPAEVGIGFYPGSTLVEQSVMRMASAEGTHTSFAMHTDDDVAKVANFFREQVKAKSAGGTFQEINVDGGALLTAAGAEGQSSLQVNVNKAEQGGTDIVIVSQSRAPAAK